MPGKFKFADRVGWELNPNKISSILTSLKRSKTKIIDLTVSNPTECGFKYPNKEILSAFNKKENLTYAPSSQGLLSAREAVCRYYHESGINVRPENIFLTASTSEGYSFVFKLIADNNDTIIFPKPSYPLFEYLVSLNDLNMATYPLVHHDEKGWILDIEALTDNIDDRVKAIIIVNPNNPTGSFLSEEELGKINDLIKGKNVSLISDEVFYDYKLNDNSKYPSLITNEKNLTFVLGGLSKSLGMPQMKLSWIIINGPKEHVRDACERLEVIADTYLSVSTPAQNALPKWFEIKCKIQKDIMKRISTNLQAIKKAISEAGNIKCLDVQGGWYAVLKLPNDVNEEDFITELLEKDHVYVQPGYFFDFEDEPYIVISLLTQTDILKTGLERIIEFTL